MRRLERVTPPARVKAIQAMGEAERATLPLQGVEGPLSVKQRSLLRHAVEMGYCTYPRRASLSDMASRLEMSRTTLTQRLRKAESLVMEELGAAGLLEVPAGTE